MPLRVLVYLAWRLWPLLVVGLALLWLQYFVWGCVRC